MSGMSFPPNALVLIDPKNCTTETCDTNAMLERIMSMYAKRYGLRSLRNAVISICDEFENEDAAEQPHQSDADPRLTVDPVIDEE